MFQIVGILVVFGCVVTGYLMEKGQIAVLLQPSELIIIGGAAIGTLLTANPMHILKKILTEVGSVIKGSPFSKQRYLDTLKMMFDLLAKSRKRGQSPLKEISKSRIAARSFRGTPSFSKTIMLAILFAIRCAWRSRAESVRLT